MMNEEKQKYASLFKTNNIISISKDDLLIIVKEKLDSCIKLGEWKNQWEFMDDEDSIIPCDAGRIQGLIELIFNQKIESMNRNEDIIFITFKKM